MRGHTQAGEGLSINHQLAKTLPSVRDDVVLSVSFPAAEIQHQPLLAHLPHLDSTSGLDVACRHFRGLLWSKRPCCIHLQLLVSCLPRG